MIYSSNICLPEKYVILFNMKKKSGGHPLQLFSILSVKSPQNTFKTVFQLLIELQYVSIYQKMQNFIEKKYDINDFFPKMSIIKVTYKKLINYLHF